MWINVGCSAWKASLIHTVLREFIALLYVTTGPMPVIKKGSDEMLPPESITFHKTR